jgi:hypothetical protein
MVAAALFAWLAFSQTQAAPQASSPPQETPALEAKLGTCSADFTVKDAQGKPVYHAIIRVSVRYGPLNVKRMDLEVGTDTNGKARLGTLPDKAKPMTYEITLGDKKTTVEQVVAKTCHGMFDVLLK